MNWETWKIVEWAIKIGLVLLFVGISARGMRYWFREGKRQGWEDCHEAYQWGYTRHKLNRAKEGS